jgi:putative redox protein
MQPHGVALVPAAPGNAELISVTFTGGESYQALVRGYRIPVDQPLSSGGADSAPTPVELFVASLATCVAFYAGRYLTRHGHGRDGLTVSAAFAMASDGPARVSDIQLIVRVPAGLPAGRRSALHGVVSHCAVHNTLVSAPSVTIELA